MNDGLDYIRRQLRQPAPVEEQVEAADALLADQDIERQAEVQYKRRKADRLALAKEQEEEAKLTPLSWVQVDHDEAFALSRDRLIPDIGHMVEGNNSPPLPLLYSGKINGVYGDSEAGKSWLALWICVQELIAGKHVLYLDFEDDAGGVYRRLIALGASESVIREFFHYVNPQGKLTVFEKLSYASLVNIEGPKSLAVVDGVTEAMALESLTGRDEGEVAKWHQLVTKPLANAGWGTFTIDHMPHGESRVIGSQHKRAAVTGVSYELESVTPFATGQKGRSRLLVAKDRPGWIRGEAAPGPRPQHYGDFILDAESGVIQAAIWPWLPPRSEEEEAEREMEPDVPLQRKILRFVEKNPGCTARGMRGYLKSRPERLAHEVDRLVRLGHLTTEKGPRNSNLLHFDHGLD